MKGRAVSSGCSRSLSAPSWVTGRWQLSGWYPSGWSPSQSGPRHAPDSSHSGRLLPIHPTCCVLAGNTGSGRSGSEATKLPDDEGPDGAAIAWPSTGMYQGGPP
jgi:hypothetical protein